MQIETRARPRTHAARNEACGHHERCRASLHEDESAQEHAHEDAHEHQHQQESSRALVWNHVIERLVAGYRNDTEARAYRAVPLTREAASGPSRHRQVEVIERLSDTSIAVLWQDATLCRYADQVWISCRARLKGRCALSGATIRRNDPIYKPRVRSAVPVNAAAMILASVVDVQHPLAQYKNFER
ncbi:DUF3331 domain-containing protein [Burkholderia sp. WSM2232]|uniref:DUF3331 domain-containing protein n=1 Tax=Burkholderia sp. WSM2232 TaxID=944436 RepID=UPI0003F6DCA6|nr:DUF3331 domain-containing protein [Burkholderia sp. WSM2232]